MKSWETIITELAKRDMVWAYAKRNCKLGKRRIKEGDQIDCSAYGSTPEGPYVGVMEINGKFIRNRLDIVLDLDDWEVYVRVKVGK